MKVDIREALRELTDEKSIPVEVLIQAIEEALAVAYKRNFDSDEVVRVSLDEKNGEFKVYSRKTVVEDEAFEDPNSEYSLTQAQKLADGAKVGNIIEKNITPPSFGRIAAQTTRQVVSQKLREVERDRVSEEYRKRVGELVTGKVQHVDRGNVYVEFDKAIAVLQNKDQIPGEFFRTNDRIKSCIQDVKVTPKGPQIILTRNSSKFVELLFSQAVPEIADGTVEIKASSREPGLRVKLSVYTEDDRIDPLGACVGLKGSRIKTVVDELNGEKIDIVKYSDNLVEYVMNALSPAKVKEVRVDEENRTALAIVPQNQLSLAIGKEGQNVKLASKLTGIKIDIKTEQDIAQQELPDVGADSDKED
ncbi:MAG: transcription termination/antitermination protein NusA [Candidatus Riflebacteria bacterium]|nr:transcription termination/antitermination protein NusA [Candidatus Riflebacteria bacterium]